MKYYITYSSIRTRCTGPVIIFHKELGYTTQWKLNNLIDCNNLKKTRWLKRIFHSTYQTQYKTKIYEYNRILSVTK